MKLADLAEEIKYSQDYLIRLVVNEGDDHVFSFDDHGWLVDEHGKDVTDSIGSYFMLRVDGWSYEKKDKRLYYDFKAALRLLDLGLTVSRKNSKNREFRREDGCIKVRTSMLDIDSAVAFTSEDVDAKDYYIVEGENACKINLPLMEIKPFVDCEKPRGVNLKKHFQLILHKLSAGCVVTISSEGENYPLTLQRCANGNVMTQEKETTWHFPSTDRIPFFLAEWSKDKIISDLEISAEPGSERWMHFGWRD